MHVINIDIQDNHEEATIGAFIICELVSLVRKTSCADPEGGQGVWTPPENHKNIGFLAIQVRIP